MLTAGRAQRAVSLRSERSMSRGFPSVELDTVLEERSDPEQTQVSRLGRTRGPRIRKLYISVGVLNGHFPTSSKSYSQSSQERDVLSSILDSDKFSFSLKPTR